MGSKTKKNLRKATYCCLFKTASGALFFICDFIVRSMILISGILIGLRSAIFRILNHFSPRPCVYILFAIPDLPRENDYLLAICRE